jgi:integron integrase
MDTKLSERTGLVRVPDLVVVPAIVQTSSLEPSAGVMPVVSRGPKLLTRMRETLRVRHCSPSTEKQYLQWARRYVRFHGVRHPNELGAEHLREFLTHLAVDAEVSASTQSQALAAILFLYKHVLGRPLGWMAEGVRAKPGHRVPTVMTHEEALRVIGQLEGGYQLVARLLYGSGLRLNEALALRVNALDFDRLQILVRGGKGDKDRWTLLPRTAVADLRAHLEVVRQGWHADSHAPSRVRTVLPEALARKFPRAAEEWAWQWVFPATRMFWDGMSWRRSHLHHTAVQREVREAVLRTGMAKRASCHTFRHSFATRLLRMGYDIRVVQELLGHRSIKTTATYLHVLNQGRGVESPLDVDDWC